MAAKRIGLVGIVLLLVVGAFLLGRCSAAQPSGLVSLATAQSQVTQKPGVSTKPGTTSSGRASREFSQHSFGHRLPASGPQPEQHSKTDISRRKKPMTWVTRGQAARLGNQLEATIVGVERGDGHLTLRIEWQNLVKAEKPDSVVVILQ